MAANVNILVLIFYNFVRLSIEKCAGGFDIYFILDKSRSLSNKNFQVQTVQFVENIIDSLSNSKTRTSLITFSETASLDLPLTGDRNEIKKGIDKLRKIEPSGRTYLKYGLNQALIQIKGEGARAASIIFVLTDGELSEKESFQKAKDLRDLFDVKIFAIGIDKYSLKELRRLGSVPHEDYVYTVTNYDALNSIANKIINTACVEVTSVEPETVCSGAQYSVTLRGKGFERTRDLSTIRCNFRLDDKEDHIKHPTEVSDTLLKCQGIVLKQIDSFVILQVALNEKRYISTDIKVTAVNCTKSNYTNTIIAILFLIMMLGLFALWWFFLLLPCVKEKKKEGLISSGEPVGSGKWPTVDASFYGGGGVGGIKPLKVKWGYKGATDEGNKLTKSPDANIINKPRDSGAVPPAPSFFQRVRMFFASVRLSLIHIGRLLMIPYRKCALWRPNKNGKSRFYSTSSERKS